jgi:hypothetical protein
MKTALLGLSNNISANINKIKLWANSFRTHSDSEVILLCADSTEDEINLCKNLGITCVPTTLQNSHEVYHKRLICTYEFLKTANIDLFIITDVHDVAFQGDPFTKLDYSSYDIFVSGEGLLVKHELWNSDNINKLFPSELQKCLNTEVINSGVIAGKRDALIKLYERMFHLCEISTDKHNIKDQAALIVMVTNKEIPKLKIFNLDDGWAMHCAVAGPTHFFTAWGFVNNIMYGIPSMKNGTVVTKSDTKFDIVHQFNRVPEWHQIIKTQNNL